MKRCLLPTVACALLAILSGSQRLRAEDWPQWRGPHFNGSTTERGLPVKWSTSDNVAWVAELPGASAATPVIHGDRVFVASTDKQQGTLKAMCLDRKSGKLLWQHNVAEGLSQDTRSNFASPSPATDGKLVVFFYGNGDLVAYTVEGQELWSQNLGPFAFQWTFSTSPLLIDGKLIMQILQRDTAVGGRGSQRGNPSYLLALDPQTGKQLWRHERPSEAQAESLEAFTTPVPFQAGGRTQLLVAGGDALTGHDLATGAELWRWETWNPGRIGHWRLVPSPVAGGGVILVCAPKRDPVYAIKIGGLGKLGDDDVAWTSSELREVSSDVPTPAFYDGDFFVLSDVRKSLTRVDPQTGAAKWSVRTPGKFKYEASPLAADGKLYLIDFSGEVAVFDARDGKLLNTIQMDEPSEDAVRSGIVAAGGQLFIRVNRKLYCVGSPAS